MSLVVAAVDSVAAAAVVGAVPVVGVSYCRGG